MFRSRIIYRFISVLLVFALMIVIPFSLSMVKQVQKMIEAEEKIEQVKSEEYSLMHKEFTGNLVEQMLPFIFYIIVLAFMLSFFFLRKMLMSIRNLREGSQAIKDGNFDIRLTVLSDDELGEVTRSFNDMAEALRAKTQELGKKDMYINAMLDPLWVVDEEDRITDINQAFTRLFGYSREDMLGSLVYDFVDDRNASILRKQIEERRDRGESSIYELSILSKNSVQIPVLISGSPVYSGDKIVGKIGVIKDFREQSSLRHDLQQSLDYIETIMDSIPDELVVIDRSYRINMVNKVAAMNAGHDLIGQLCHQVLHASSVPCWAEGHECPTQAVFATGKNHQTVHQHVDAQGGLRYHEILASPVADASGKVIHVIELLRDVTDRMKSEEQIVQKNKELTALNSISGILNRSLKPDEIFTKVLDKMIELLGMDGGGIFFLDESAKEMICQYHKGISEDYVKMLGRVRLGDDIPGKVAVTGQVMTTSDISKDERIERSVMKHSGMRGYCCIPIKGKERIIGVFSLFSFTAHLFTAEEESILSAVGEMTGMALENIKLYARMRSLFDQQKNRWTEEHQQLLQISTRLGAAVDIEDSMMQVLGLIKQVFRADFVWMLSNDQAHNLLLRFATGTTEKEGTVIYPSEASSFEKYALSKRHPAVVSDIRSEEKFYFSQEVSSYHSAVAVPMFVGEKPVGVCSLYYSMQREFRDEDLRFMEIITNMISVAIERSEFYSRAGKEKELADTILQSVHEGIITVDIGGRIIAVNQAFEGMTGIRPDRAINLQVCEVFRFSDDNISFRLLLGESVEEAKQGISTMRSSTITTRYGNRLPVTITSSPILDSNGTVTGIVNLIRDVSREKELDKMKTELIRSVSHEFRTPLSAIVGMTEMLLHGDVEDTKVNQYLNIIRNEGMRLTRMVNELLSIARIESGKEMLKLGIIDMGDLLKGVAETFMTRLEDKKAVLRHDLGGVATIVADEEKMKQLLINFIDNSLTFSDDGCIIEVAVKRNDAWLEISIADSGWGIPEEDIPHLAERFYRGKHGDRVKGTGLGLALCYEILRMHEGGMKIESRLGEGTKITMSIPYREVL
ncbi:MAG: PAS domain S-box protein [Nitrospirota bacterium]|nr:PAS domain S-box protein [Nitrospirota bacterium]